MLLGFLTAELSPPDLRQALTTKISSAFWLGTHRQALVRQSSKYFLISAFLWARVWVVICRLKLFGPWVHPSPVRVKSVATNSLTSVGWDLSQKGYLQSSQIKQTRTNQDPNLAQDFCTFTSCHTCILWEISTREPICRIIITNTDTENPCFSHWSKYTVQVKKFHFLKHAIQGQIYHLGSILVILREI